MSGAAQSYRRKITFEDRRRAVIAMLNADNGRRRIRITPGQRKAILNGTAHRRRNV